MADIEGLRARLSQAQSIASVAEEEYAQLQAAANSSNFARDANGQIIDQQAFLSARKAASDFRVNVLQPAQAAVSDAELSLTQAENSNASDATPPVASSTSTAADEVQSSDQGATQNPPPAAEVLVVPESEVNVVRDLGPAEESEQITRDGGQAVPDDAGATKTITETQNVSETEGRDTPQAGGSPGAGAPKDDSGTRQLTAQVVRAASSTKITPRGNALDQYSSYTYNISWYIMEKNIYKTFITSSRKSLNGLQLLMRSGGISSATAGTAPTATGPNSPTSVAGAVSNVGARNSFFDVDYYIDNLELESIVMGPYNQSPHNVTRLKFTVTEPNGITLINNIWGAVNQLYGTKKLPYSLAQYCLAVRFYAYDVNGNLIPVKDNANTDPNAIIERFYPFTISNITFRVANKQVEYQIEGLPLAHYMGFGQNLGVIKQQVEISGTTVGQVLGGKSQGSSPAPADDGRATTSSPPESPSTPPLTQTPNLVTGGTAQYDQMGNYIGTY